MADFENFVKLSQRASRSSSRRAARSSSPTPPARLAPHRHGLGAADAVGQAIRGVGDQRADAADTIAIGEIRFGGRDAIEHAGVDLADQRQLAAALRMLSAIVEYVRANQAIVIARFLLMGAMSPVSIPATLVQQVAEALAAIALAQLSRPGAR